MKSLIKKILREETSGFDPKMLNALYQYMNFLTKDYVWYYDTPENRFEYSPESIWLINPKTEEWALELEKDGELWWSIYFYYNFEMYFNMEESDFHKFIKVWVEDVLNQRVSKTRRTSLELRRGVEDALKNGKQMK